MLFKLDVHLVHPCVIHDPSGICRKLRERASISYIYIFTLMPKPCSLALTFLFPILHLSVVVATSAAWGWRAHRHCDVQIVALIDTGPVTWSACGEV